MSRRIVEMPPSERREVVGFISLDSRHRLIRQRDLVTGTRSSVPIDTGALLSQALYDHAAGILLYHNHPSGDLSISTDDLSLTERLTRACTALGVSFLDHLVIGDGSFISLRLTRPDLFEPSAT
jgi:DNA repair protein RadC